MLITRLLIFYSDSRQHPEMMGVVPRENPQLSPYGYRPMPTLTNNQQVMPNHHSTSIRPSLSSHDPSRDSSRDESRGSTRFKRRRSPNISSRSGGSRASLTAEDYDTARHMSRTCDDTGALYSAPETKRCSSEDVSLEHENQVVSLGARNVVARRTKADGHHDIPGSLGNHGDDSKVSPSVAEESQSTADDEENSSDDSDASFFSCGQCCKSFAQRSVLQIHVCPNRPHKPYHCGHCTQSFDHQNDLRMHAVIHAGEKPFKCGYCSRSFSGATTLHNHVRTHTGEKPFLCERCGKTFTQASQLHKHEAIPGDCVP